MLYFSRWKTISIWIVVLLGVMFALPNLASQSTLAGLPDWMPKRQMTLGLDLQGGSHMLLQIDRQGLAEDRLDTIRDDVRSSLRSAGIGYTGLAESGSTVQIRVRDEEQFEAARTALQALAEPVSSGLFGTGVVTEVNLVEAEPGLFRLSLSDEGQAYRLN